MYQAPIQSQFLSFKQSIKVKEKYREWWGGKDLNIAITNKQTAFAALIALEAIKLSCLYLILFRTWNSQLRLKHIIKNTEIYFSIKPILFYYSYVTLQLTVIAQLATGAKKLKVLCQAGGRERWTVCLARYRQVPQAIQLSVASYQNYNLQLPSQLAIDIYSQMLAISKASRCRCSLDVSQSLLSLQSWGFPLFSLFNSLYLQLGIIVCCGVCAAMLLLAVCWSVSYLLQVQVAALLGMSVCSQLAKLVSC